MPMVWLARRREWQPTAVFLPGKFHGQKSLEGYSLWGCKSGTRLSDSTTTMQLTQKEFLCKLDNDDDVVFSGSGP